MVLAFMVYLSALSILLFTSFPAVVNKQQGIFVRKYYLFPNYMIPIVTVTLLFGLRYGVGDDFFTYKNIYENFQYMDEKNKLEYIYYAIVTFLRKMNLPYYTMNAIMIFLTFFFIYLFLKKFKCIDRNLALFFYFACHLFITLNAQRHIIACAIFLYSLVYLYKRNFIKYFLLLIIAAGFHTSILSMLPFYTIFPIFYKDKTYSINIRILLALVTIWIMMFNQKIFMSSMDFILQIASFTQYGIHGAWIFMDKVNEGSGVGIIMKFISGIICILYSAKLHKVYGKQFDVLFLMFLFGLWGELLSGNYTYFLRFFMPFSMLRIVIYSMLIAYLLKSKKMINLIIAMFFLFLYAGYFLGQILLRGPYEFISGG